MPSPVRATRRDWCGCACASGRGQSGKNSSRLGHCAGVYRRARLARVQFCLPWSHAQVCSLLPAPRGHRVSASSSAFQHTQDAGRGHGRRASLMLMLLMRKTCARLLTPQLRGIQSFLQRVASNTISQARGSERATHWANLLLVPRFPGVHFCLCVCVCVRVCCDDKPFP